LKGGERNFGSHESSKFVCAFGIYFQELVVKVELTSQKEVVMMWHLKLGHM